jgi:hypothetical protein
MTRLLKTAIIGRSANTVASSWIDMLAGLSGEYILRMPPAFCANAGSAVTATSNGTAIANAPRYDFISVKLLFAVGRRPIVWALMQNERYSSSQTSSKRHPLKTLFTIILRPLTRGCQQVANRR